MNVNQPFGRNNTENICMLGHHNQEGYRIKVSAEVRYGEEISGVNLEAEVIRHRRKQST